MHQRLTGTTSCTKMFETFAEKATFRNCNVSNFGVFIVLIAVEFGVDIVKGLRISRYILASWQKIPIRVRETRSGGEK